MSVIITGVNKAESCGRCNFIAEDEKCRDYCKICYVNIYDSDKVHPECPLKSAEELVRLLEEQKTKDPTMAELSRYHEGLSDAIEILKQCCEID